MGVRKIPTERFSIISAKRFEDVVASIDAAIGHPVLHEFVRAITAAESYSELEEIVSRATGPTDLMEFLRFDMGTVLGKGKAGVTPKSIRLLIGNPVTMRKMTEHVADAAAYAPITVLIDERSDGVHLSYDRIASSLSPYSNAATSSVAEDLDRNVEKILTTAAG